MHSAYLFFSSFINNIDHAQNGSNTNLSENITSFIKKKFPKRKEKRKINPSLFKEKTVHTKKHK